MYDEWLSPREYSHFLKCILYVSFRVQIAKAKFDTCRKCHPALNATNLHVSLAGLRSTILVQYWRVWRRVFGRCLVGIGRCTVGIGRCMVGIGRCMVGGSRCMVGIGRCSLGIGRSTVGIGRWAVVIARSVVSMRGGIIFVLCSSRQTPRSRMPRVGWEGGVSTEVILWPSQLQNNRYCHPLEVGWHQSTALGVEIKMSDEHLRPFYVGVSPPPPFMGVWGDSWN